MQGLKSAVMTGLGWTAGTNFLGQIVTWTVTIIVMRVLSPADYGLLAMASVFVAFLSMMAAAGLGPAIIQTSKLDDWNLRQLLGLIVVINFVLFLLLFSVAPLIAVFFDEPQLAHIVRLLAVQFLISSFAVIPESLLGRALKFKARGLVDLLANVTGGMLTLALALSGYGVWSLVVGAMVTTTAKTVGLNLIHPFIRWPVFSLLGVGRMLTFGGNVTAGRILWFVYSQADMFIVGKLLGKESLGFYSVAMHLASLPVQKISGILNQVAYPAFAQVQRDQREIAGYVLKSVRILSFFAFPVLWGISSIAPEIVRLLLGPKWEAAILPLQVLPAIMPLRMVGNFLPSAVDAVGRPDISVKNLIVASIVMPAAFLIGGQWGIVGLCAAWVIGFPLIFAANLSRALPAINLRVSEFMRAMAWPALASFAMYIAVIAAGVFAIPAVVGVWRLSVLAGVGVVVYCALAVVTNRRGLEEMYAIVRR